MIVNGKKRKRFCFLLPALFLLNAVGCSFASTDDPPGESGYRETETSFEESQNETPETNATGYREIPEISLSQGEGTPRGEDEALFSASPVGGNPAIFFFDDGLTFWFRNYLSASADDAEYYTGTLTLPDGFTNGRVVHVTRGGGSGEIFVSVEATRGETTEYLCYAFFGMEPPTKAEILDELQTRRLLETLSSLQTDAGASFPDDFVFPITDGSTSTTNLDAAVRSAILGGEQKVAHSKTYTAFENLLTGKCELIFTTPLSDAQLQTMRERGFRHEAEPVAGEGFVFVVHRDNPVDSLTVEQLRGIYSGEIVNWSEVGGNDAEILAYQRNADSGSQNYMIAFMGDAPLMEPVIDQIPASMSGILDAVAAYDNGVNAIGYSVYAYSDGMYGNLSEVKYIKVNGVEPSPSSLADGSYPLLGYNYAVFSADESENSNVRALVKWMQSDDGQRTLAAAGYIPYRRVDGLTLPDSTMRTPYIAVGDSGISQPEETADYAYQCYRIPDSFPTDGLDEKIQSFLAEAADELLQIDEKEMREFIFSRSEYAVGPELVTRKKLVNGYLSLLVGWRYDLGAQDSPEYYYDVRTATFDIFTGKRLELSELFFDGTDVAAILNESLAAEAVAPYSGFGGVHAALRDFTGLYEGEFTFTVDSVIFKPGGCFADGVELSLDAVKNFMVSSVSRDMAGYLPAETPTYKTMYTAYCADIGRAVEKNGVTIWYLDAEKGPVAGEVCAVVNRFIDSLYEERFTEDKLLAAAREIDAEFSAVSIGPWPDFEVGLCGNRYVEVSGANTAFPQKGEESSDVSFAVIEGQHNPYYFSFFFNATTGEELKPNDLFTAGWEDVAERYVYDENFREWDTETWTDDPAERDLNRCVVTGISNYSATPYTYGDLRDLAIPVVLYATDENGDSIVFVVPREYIR